MASQTLLDVLRSRTAVDCDTLDASVAAELGPFVDCTSNQAIACSELQEDRHKDLLKKAATLAKDASPKYPGVKVETLAVEIAVSSTMKKKLGQQNHHLNAHPQRPD